MARNYEAEYRRRKQRGLARGLTLSQARGHARAGEAAQKRKSARSVKALAAAVRHFLKAGDFRAAAKAERVAPERLRRALYADGHVRRERTHLVRLRREMDVPTRGRIRTLKLDFPAASRAGEFLNAVRTFRSRPDPLLLKPFEGSGVTDLSGRFHTFETDPNTLYELALTEGGIFEQVYRLVTIA